MKVVARKDDAQHAGCQADAALDLKRATPDFEADALDVGRTREAVWSGLDIHLCPLKAPCLDLLDTAAQIAAESRSILRVE